MKEITMQEVKDFCDVHGAMRSRLEFDSPAGYHYKFIFENGDTYEISERGDAYKKTVTIILNGERENVTSYVYRDFGWRAVA